MKRLDDRRIAAIHEAGHAIGAIACGLDLSGIELYTREPGQPFGGLTFVTGESQRLEDVFRDALTDMAGPAAQGVLERCSRIVALLGGGHGDCQHMHAVLGNPTKGEEAARAERVFFSLARRVVLANWAAVERVAGLLLERGRLDGDDVDKVAGPVQYVDYVRAMVPRSFPGWKDPHAV